MFVNEMGGGRGPVDERAPVHDRLSMVCLRGGWRRGGAVHEPAPVFMNVLIGFFIDLFR